MSESVTAFKNKIPMVIAKQLELYSPAGSGKRHRDKCRRNVF
jgi:hypothetical protein